MHRKKLLFFLSTAFCFCGTMPVAEGLRAEQIEASDEEAFLLRRIAEFWKDGDYEIVKAQINDFLKKYPSSSLHDYLLGILGDLQLQEGEYALAVETYGKITSPPIVEKVLLNKLQGYYELNRYEKIANEGEPYLYNTSSDFAERRDEFHFLMAEAYFRRALDAEEAEVAEELAARARPFYEGLRNSEYNDVSTFALAEIYRLQNENEKGAELYRELAKIHPEKKERLLFNAGVLEANIDQEKAMSLFDEVIALDGEKKHDAAYNRLLIAFDMGNHDYVIENHRAVYPYIPEEQADLFNFMVGKSYYAAGEYAKAITPISKYLAGNPDSSEQRKDALLIHMTCAKELDDEALFSQALGDYKEAFPDDSELAKAYFMHAMMCKVKGNYDEAQHDLQVIARDFPEFAKEEGVLYEYALIAHDNEKWELSYDVLQNYLSHFPSGERAESAWRHFLSCCLHLAKEEEESGYTKERLLGDLQKVLAVENGLDGDERKEYRLLYAKLSYEVGYFNEALEQLDAYIAEYPDDPSLAEAHLLSALSLNKLASDLPAFCAHLEEAMATNPAEYDKGAIHLQLYNGYITLFEEEGEEGYTAKAAEHLYAAAKSPESAISFDNQIWLAGHYYARAKRSLGEKKHRFPLEDRNAQIAFERAAEMYESAFAQKEIDVTRKDLEPEVLKYVDLLSYRGEAEKKLALLETLIEMQNSHTDVEWKFRRQALFELAQSYEQLDEQTHALETYQFLLTEAQGVISPLTTMSKLRSSVIRYKQIPEKYRDEKNPEVLAVLNDLKELQIRKSLDSEPTHLEAALHYANIRAELSSDQKRDERYLFFLTRLKEDYTSQDDLINQEYHTALATRPEKKELYNSYMQFVEAEMLRVQSSQLSQADQSKALKFQQMSAELFTSLKELSSLPSPLDERIAKSVKQLEESRLR